MYAVIQSGGKQYRVTVGDRLKVESLKLDPGSKLSLDNVLLVADGEDVEVGGPNLSTKVEATVVGHGRGEKVRIFKLRRRKNSRQQAGHRQNFTELEIVSIAGKSAQVPTEKAAKKAKVEEPQVDDQTGQEASGIEETAAAEEAANAAASKPAAKKKTTRKKAAQKTKEES